MDQTPDTSESLIARVKDLTDAAAWGQFLEIYRPVVLRLARRRLQDADAQDVTQKVLMAVSQAIGRWNPGVQQPPFRVWLATIARNAVLNALSRRKPDAGTGSSSLLEALHQQAAENQDTTAELLLESRREAMRWAIEQIRAEFSGTTWSLFWETAVLDRPVAEVATAAGRTVGAVYMARFKVMQRLKERIAEVSLP